jgi:hypothetical protein
MWTTLMPLGMFHRVTPGEADSGSVTRGLTMTHNIRPEAASVGGILG